MFSKIQLSVNHFKGQIRGTYLYLSCFTHVQVCMYPSQMWCEVEMCLVMHLDPHEVKILYFSGTVHFTSPHVNIDKHENR
jgi:hypothetical protein